jgi:hypothetical protein
MDDVYIYIYVCTPLMDDIYIHNFTLGVAKEFGISRGGSFGAYLRDSSLF